MKLFGKKKKDEVEAAPENYMQTWRQEKEREEREREAERKKKEKAYLRQAHLTLISVLISGIAIGISICTILIRNGVLGGD